MKNLRRFIDFNFFFMGEFLDLSVGTGLTVNCEQIDLLLDVFGVQQLPWMYYSWYQQNFCLHLSHLHWQGLPEYKDTKYLKEWSLEV